MIGKISVLILTIILILILGLIPQINVTGYIQPTVTSKTIYFIYCCFLVVFVCISYIILNQKKQLQFSTLDILLFVLLLYIALNKFIIQPYSSFSIRYIELLGLSAIYLAVRIVGIKHFIWILLAIIVSGIIQAVHGNLQLLGYDPSNHSGFKMTGSFFNPGPYAGFLAAIWPLALGVYFFKENLFRSSYFINLNGSKIWNIIIRYGIECIALLGIITILLVLPASRSRAAWLSVVISSAILIEYRYHILKRILSEVTKVKTFVLVTMSVVIIGGGLYSIYHFKKGSSEGRLFIWDVSTQIIKDNPVTGVGFDRFKAHYMNYQAAYFMEASDVDEGLVADNSYYAFNEFLQFIVEEGCLGGLILLGLIFLIFKIKPKEEFEIFYQIVIGGLLAIAAFAFFSYPMQILPIKLVLVVLIALLATLDDNKWQYQFKKINNYILFSGRMASICFLFLGLFNFFWHIRAIDCAMKNWQTAFVTYNYADYAGSLEHYRKAYPFLRNDGDFLMNYGKTLAMTKKYDEAVMILEAAKHHLNTTIIETALGDAYKALEAYDKAETAYLCAANMIPIRFYPLYLLAKLYDESGQDSKAVTMATTILEKDIKIPSTAIREIKAEMKKMITDKTENNPTN